MNFRGTRGTITLTLGDAGENHTGMEMLGQLGRVGSGFSPAELRQMCQTEGLMTEYHDFSLTEYPLANEAGVLIIRHYLDNSIAQQLLQELLALNWDRRYWDRRRGKVLNKLARANLVIADGVSQEAQYDVGRGTIVDGLTLPCFRQFKEGLSELIVGEKGNDLICEGNLYDDPAKNGIGYHGDTERRKVIALRLGESMSMSWQWFHRCKPVGEGFRFTLNHGDLYIMSEWAVGNEWRSSSLYTLRHAAGAKKYLDLQRYQNN